MVCLYILLLHKCVYLPLSLLKSLPTYIGDLKIWMFAIGCLSLWGVHIQKSKHLTLYESRLEKSANKQSRSFRIQGITTYIYILHLHLLSDESHLSEYIFFVMDVFVSRWFHSFHFSACSCLFNNKNHIINFIKTKRVRRRSWMIGIWVAQAPCEEEEVRLNYSNKLLVFR